LIVSFLFAASPVLAQKEKEKTKPSASQEQQTPDKEALFKKFEETLSGAKLVGSFTVLGKDGPLRKEEYTITKVSKLPKEDYWLFTTESSTATRTLPCPCRWK